MKRLSRTGAFETKKNCFFFCNFLQAIVEQWWLNLYKYILKRERNNGCASCNFRRLNPSLCRWLLQHRGPGVRAPGRAQSMQLRRGGPPGSPRPVARVRVRGDGALARAAEVSDQVGLAGDSPLQHGVQQSQVSNMPFPCIVYAPTSGSLDKWIKRLSGSNLLELRFRRCIYTRILPPDNLKSDWYTLKWISQVPKWCTSVLYCTSNRETWCNFLYETTILNTVLCFQHQVGTKWVLNKED